VEQIYYTQCPIGYGQGNANGFQIKRRSPGYPAAGDFRHLAMRPFLPWTERLAPPTLRYRREGGVAEVAWLTPRTHEFETERGPWGRPGGFFAHGLRLAPEEMAALAHWPAGLHDRPFWRRADPGPSQGQPPEPIALGLSSLRCRPTFAAVAPLAAGEDVERLARLLTALAGVTREGRTLFLIDEAARLPDLVALLTFAFPGPLRADLTFSTYHDRPEDLPGYRLQGTIPEARPDLDALAALGVVADMASDTFHPPVAPTRWSLVLAGWFVGRTAADEAAWDRAAQRAQSHGASEAPEVAWSDARLDRLVGLSPASRPPASAEGAGRESAGADVRPEGGRPPGVSQPDAPERLPRVISLQRLFEKRGMKLIREALDLASGAGVDHLRDDAWYRERVIDPAWGVVPLMFRLLGRRRLCWDEFFLKLRDVAFDTAGGRVSLRPDWEPAAGRLLAGWCQPAEGGNSGAAGSPPGRPDGSSPPPTRTDPQAHRDAVPPGGSKIARGPAPEPMASPGLARAQPTPGERAEAPRVADAEGPPDGPPTAVGIDLGTTFSAVATLDRQGRPVCLVNSSGDVLTPSVVFFDGDEIVVGKEAVAASAMEPERVADCVKRDMGAKAYRKRINGEVLPPEVISSLVLRKLKADAERKIGPIRNAVITVPAYFDEPRRRATADAGRLAGLEVLDIINEPTAAALAYGFQLGRLDGQGKLRGERPLTILVYDLGGGTFDVSVVEIRGDAFRVLATDGDVRLGGKDWDEALVDLAAEEFRRVHREDPRENPLSLQDLHLAAEACKRTLSERSRATLYVNHLGLRHKLEVTRQGFEEATAALLGTTRTTTEIVAMQAHRTWPEIDVILLVGGSTRMPMVARMLEKLTGKVPDQSVSADEAVAHGAALYADLLLRKGGPAGDRARFSVTNVNAHSLGLVGIDPRTERRVSKILIPKNTPLPRTVSRRFKTLKPDQRSVRIVVLEGESEIPEACTRVGQCVIRGLPPGLPAGWPVEVRYSYGENGRLNVRGKLVLKQARFWPWIPSGFLLPRVRTAISGAPPPRHFTT